MYTNRQLYYTTQLSDLQATRVAMRMAELNAEGITVWLR